MPAAYSPTTGPPKFCELQLPVSPQSQGLIPRLDHNSNCCCLQPATMRPWSPVLFLETYPHNSLAPQQALTQDTSNLPSSIDTQPSDSLSSSGLTHLSDPFHTAEWQSVSSPTQCTQVWATSKRQWRTGKPGVLQSMGSRRVGHNSATEQQILDQICPAAFWAHHKDCFYSYFWCGE